MIYGWRERDVDPVRVLGAVVIYCSLVNVAVNNLYTSQSPVQLVLLVCVSLALLVSVCVCA